MRHWPNDQKMMAFFIIAGLIGIAGLLYSQLSTRPAPPRFAGPLKAVLKDCAERNTFAATPAPEIYINVNGLTTCLWLNGVTVSLSTPVGSR